jgi:hypothetical protein
MSQNPHLIRGGVAVSMDDEVDANHIEILDCIANLPLYTVSRAKFFVGFWFAASLAHIPELDDCDAGHVAPTQKKRAC